MGMESGYMKTSLDFFSIALIATACCLPAAATTPDNPATIRVRVLDSRTHAPLKGRRIQVTLSGMDGQFHHEAITKIGRSGPDGLVVFDLGATVPPRVDVFDLSGYPCSSPEVFPISDILKDGVVAQVQISTYQKVIDWCTPDNGAAKIEQRPGGVGVLTHPLNILQNFWYTLRR